MRRPETRLVRMHSARGSAWFVIPGGPVDHAVAIKIQNHPLIRAGSDGLFPGHDQTWRMVS
jgi:hypothetical protein